MFQPSQTTTATPIYRAESGRIISAQGYVLTPAQARLRRSALLSDIEQLELTYGETDPEMADLLIAGNLRNARQLREAIREVEGHTVQAAAA